MGKYDENLSSPFGRISHSNITYIKLAIFLIQSLWMLSFIVHSFYFILNASVIFWYFSDDKVVDGKEKEKPSAEPNFWYIAKMNLNLNSNTRAKCCQCFKGDSDSSPKVEDSPVKTADKLKVKALKDKQIEESAETPIELE